VAEVAGQVGRMRDDGRGTASEERSREVDAIAGEREATIGETGRRGKSIGIRMD